LVRTAWVATLVAIVLTGWNGAPYAADASHDATPLYEQMLSAATIMEAASELLLAEKQARGIWPGPEIDPNATGMVGHEYTTMTTTAATLENKRAPTSTDFAAALVRFLAENGIGRGDKVLLVMSGSFLGADIASIAALEALEADFVLVPSLGASQWGTNDPTFNLLDILALLREHGIIRAAPLAGVIGGNGAIGTNMDRLGDDPGVLDTLRASFAEHDVPLIETRPLNDIVSKLAGLIDEEIGGAEKIEFILKAGSSAISTGADPDRCEFPTGLQERPPMCAGGVPGLLHVVGSDDLRFLNLLNMRQLTEAWGVAYDPIPLPTPGENRLVYGH